MLKFLSLKILYPDFQKNTTVEKVNQYIGIGQKAFYFSHAVAKHKIWSYIVSGIRSEKR
jgi:hypothetical protein